jgi:hypothetical protein
MIKPEEKIVLQDLKAFLEFALENELPLLEVLSTIGHDVRGIIMRDKCFLPRTAGYAERINKPA